jgi:hypothetical protein
MKVSFRLCLTVASVIILGAAAASAQDVYKVNYFDNNLPAPGVIVPQNFVRIDNPGLTYGNLCAMIYVFDADQQMSECCGCIESHNGLRKLSVRRDLTAKPLTGVLSQTGVIKVVSAAVNGTSCDPSANVSPKANLRVWGTHVQDAAAMTAVSSTGATNPIFYYPVTETESSDSPLGATELANLQAQCSFIHILGSGAGICTCGTGD